MLLAFISIIHDWMEEYNHYYPQLPGSWITPIWNVNFLSSVLFIAAFGFINVVNQNKNYVSALASRKKMAMLMTYAIPAILLFVLYFAFRMEIANYWYQHYMDSNIIITNEYGEELNYFWNFDLKKFGSIWMLNYSLLFFSALAFFNFKKLKNAQLGIVNLVLLAISMAFFLTEGLYTLSELRTSYLQQTLSEYYHTGPFNIWFRYLSLVFVVLALIAIYKYTRQDFMKYNLKLPFDLLLHTTILWVASSELLNLMDMGGASQSYKLALSILWGIYSLFLISMGIWKKKKHLRVGAIALFGLTLLKLFFYDISHLETIAKTIVLVSLGVLMLIISFLYNKYKHLITDETKD
jgi:uncharacterized membrane protein